MPKIAPGRWVRYAGRRDLSAVACPPYDVIDDKQAAALEAADPHNFVRLVRPRAEPGEPAEGRYHRARALLDEWLAEYVLSPDPEPSILAVEQAFEDHGTTRVRRGVLALLELSEFSEGAVLPHEKTLSAPKADRLRLLETVQAHLSPVFVLYPDPENAVVASLADVFASEPTHVALQGGVRHRAWRVTDKARIEAIRAQLAPRKGFIADGHHRYETALQYRRLAKERGRKVEGTPLDHVPAFLCAMSDPGLAIFPTHRLVHGLSFDIEKLEAGLARFFSAAAVKGDDRAKVEAALAAAGTKGTAVGLVTAEGPVRVLALKADAPLAEVPGLPADPALRALDVSVLHAVVLEHLLGMSRESQEKQANLRYLKDLGEAVGEVREGRAQLAFLLNPTKMDEVRAVAEAGQTMPQKSTYFFPKVLDGLALQKL